MLVAFQRATGWALPRPAVAVQQPPHSRDRATDLELAADQRLDAFQGPPLIFPAMHGRPLGQLLFQQGEPLVRQLRQLRGPLRPQPLHTALTPVPAPLLHRTLAHPQVLGNVRSPVTPGEPLPGLQPDPLTRSPPLSRQAPTFRIPHSTGIPQGSPNVTTRRQPEKVSSAGGVAGVGVLAELAAGDVRQPVRQVGGDAALCGGYGTPRLLVAIFPVSLARASLRVMP